MRPTVGKAAGDIAICDLRKVMISEKELNKLKHNLLTIKQVTKVSVERDMMFVTIDIGTVNDSSLKHVARRVMEKIQHIVEQAAAGKHKQAALEDLISV